MSGIMLATIFLTVVNLCVCAALAVFIKDIPMAIDDYQKEKNTEKAEEEAKHKQREQERKDYEAYIAWKSAQSGSESETDEASAGDIWYK
jgi:ATPase subunit of ABC transporter with duplicated ATPase domains